jgi:hypothetical protein
MLIDHFISLVRGHLRAFGCRGLVEGPRLQVENRVMEPLPVVSKIELILAG